MVLRTRCVLKLSSCAPDALGKDGLLMTKEPEMKVAFKQLQAVLEIFYLMACFFAGGGCELGTLISNRHLPLLTRGQVYSRYVRIVMWHATET